MFAPSGHDDRLTNEQLEQRFLRSEYDFDRTKEEPAHESALQRSVTWQKKASPGFAGRGVEEPFSLNWIIPR